MACCVLNLSDYSSQSALVFLSLPDHPAESAGSPLPVALLSPRSSPHTPALHPPTCTPVVVPDTPDPMAGTPPPPSKSPTALPPSPVTAPAQSPPHPPARLPARSASAPAGSPTGSTPCT